ncbi:MAG TPA: methyltransferase domain-containing protein [Trebonia sp.]
MVGKVTSQSSLDSTSVTLPFSDRHAEDVPGHWLLASLGKKVLRPGGRALTERMLAALQVTDHDVVELAPGLGLTAGLLLDRQPASYTGVEQDRTASALSIAALGGRGRIVNGSAQHTGLADASVDVAVNEAMLTMNTDKAKRQIIAETARVLRPGGQYAIHELALVPDDIAESAAADLRRALARSIKVNARPLTVAEWTALLADAGFEVDAVYTADMALLEFRRLIADEGVLGTLRIAVNYLRRPDARRRVNGMWLTFRRYRHSLAAVAIVARKSAV